MTTAKALDQITRDAHAEQTGVRFEDSQNRLQTTACMACEPTQQFMTVEV